MKIAVIGVGQLGRHHVRILSAMSGVTVVAAADRRAERAAEVAGEFGVPAVSDWRTLLGRVDAVTIAVPTEAHEEVASAFIEAGAHVLVEKPMARTVEEADRLVDRARRQGVVLAVGHTERFNPAVEAARPLVVEPRFIEVHRLGTFPDRSLDIDVVLDLMIHDLDLVMDLVGRPVADFEAVGVPVLTPRVDIANVRLRFEGGCIANLTASRISRERVRKIRLFQRDRYVSIDYASQELETWRLVRGAAGATPVIEGGKMDVAREEPLRREMEDFVAAVRDGRAPLVPGEQGRAVLALGARIVEAMSRP